MLHAPAGSSSLALHAVSRLLAIAQAPEAAPGLEAAIAAEARRLAGADTALLLELDDHEGVAHLIGADPAPPGAVAPADPRLLGRALPRASRGIPERLEDASLEELGRLLGQASEPRGAVAVPVRTAGGAPHVVLVLVEGEDRLDADVLDTAAAFATAAGAALSQRELVAEQRARTAEQAALARAASALNATLDLRAVLQAACDEGCDLLGADAGVALTGAGAEGMVIEAASGLAPGTVGRRVAPGEGLSGRVALADRGLLTNDYARVVAPHRGSPFRDVQSAVCVPLRWDGHLRGALAVGFTRPRFVGARELALLEAFGEMASAACRNAVDAERLTLAARTDGLTGALNHAAMQEALAHEIERSEEDGSPLSLVLLDLDGFKQVNDRDGHLGGDDLLREVARALRLTFRPADVVARHGGDEFAVVVPDTDEQAAAALARDAVARIGLVLRRRGHAAATGATAGVARHRRGGSATDLLAAADEALLHGKQELGRGTVVRAADVPRARPLPALLPRLTTSVLAPGSSERWRLHKRTRQLVLANALGSRLAAMTDAAAIQTAVVDELHRAFGFFLVAAVRAGEDHVQAVACRGPGVEVQEGLRSQPAGRGIIGRVLRTGQMALVDDVREDPDYEDTPETASVRAEMTAPVWIGDRLWGVLNCEEPRPSAFDAEDARLLQTVADQMGAALRSAELYAQLEDAYLGTAEALAAALEAKDAYTASHARSIASWADAVGRALGMRDAALRDLRYGAIFHDIGKIAIPEAILDKRGPLDDDERAVMERHTVIGEQILRPVTFLRDVLPIVRHEHERWDGRGYPDRLAGEDIPLGARIVLVCDAFHAMTSDRPYRAAMAAQEAVAELRRGAGTQFDPRVVDVFLREVAAGA